MVRPRNDGKPSAPCKRPEGRPETWTEEIIDKYADEYLEWIQLPTSVWIKDFFLERKLLPSLACEWCKRSKKFSAAHEAIQQWQESKMFKGALFKSMNSQMAIAALNKFHGWDVDKKKDNDGDVNLFQLAKFLSEQSNKKSDESK